MSCCGFMTGGKIAAPTVLVRCNKTNVGAPIRRPHNNDVEKIVTGAMTSRVRTLRNGTEAVPYIVGAMSQPCAKSRGARCALALPLGELSSISETERAIRRVKRDSLLLTSYLLLLPCLYTIRPRQRTPKLFVIHYSLFTALPTIPI